MKRLLIACQLVALIVLAAPAGAASGGNAEWAKRCQSEAVALGFRNAGQCVSHYARGGGGVVTGPATLTLTFDVGPCASVPDRPCAWSVQGSGLDPGSEVIVGEASVLYGAPLTVDSAGNVSGQYIYHLGTCVMSGYEHPLFIARGVAADGTPIASDVVLADYTLYLPIC
jgi:hypothetical protein